MGATPIHYYVKRFCGVFKFCTTVLLTTALGCLRGFVSGIIKFQDFGHTAQLADLDVCHTCSIFWMSMEFWAAT
jgi:hypothetical protein